MKLIAAFVTALVVVPLFAQEKGTPPKGFVAQVTDSSGSSFLLHDFGFGYTYGYTMANCIGMCGSSANAVLAVLPLQLGCGTTIVPLTNVASITNIKKPAFNKPYEGLITFVDGKTLNAKFGNFGEHSVHNVRGQSSLGAYELALDKTASINFQHEKDVQPLPEEKWGASESKGKATIACAEGEPTHLAQAALYSTWDSGRMSTADTLGLKVGESDIKIDFAKIRAFERIAEGEKLNLAKLDPAKIRALSNRPTYRVTTASGETFDVVFTDNNRFVGGFVDGTFRYVRLDSLKSASFEP